MHIALGTFKGQLGENELQNARMPHTVRAWLIVKKFYCTPLTNRSGCSGDCEACILNVKNRISGMDVSSAAKPYALFTWSLARPVMAIGAVLGALTGLGAAYLLVQRSKKRGETPNLSAIEGIKLGLLVFGLLRQVSMLGSGDEK